MTNNNNSKSTQGNDASFTSNDQERQRQRRRIYLNQDEDQERSRPLPPITSLDIIRRGGIHPNAIVPRQPGVEFPYRPPDISSIIRLSTTMRNRSSTNSSTAQLNHTSFIDILDRALAICDECLDASDVIEDESDQP